MNRNERGRENQREREEGDVGKRGGERVSERER